MASLSLGILHHLVLRPPSSSPSLLIKPLTHKISPRFFCSSLVSVTLPHTRCVQPQPQPHIEEEEKEEAPIEAKSSSSAVELPSLTVKEKKELASYAHSLGKKLKIQQVGKSGVTGSLAAAFVENLESNELLKVEDHQNMKQYVQELKIHNNCPGELPDVIKQLEVTTGSVAVGQIGRSVILYRPSLTKLRAEEKKRETRRIFDRRGFRPRHTELRVKPAEFRSRSDETMEKRGRTPRLSSRGHRGSSR